MFACLCVRSLASKTDIVGQVLGPSVCVWGGGGGGGGYMCMHACVCWYTELTCIPYWAYRAKYYMCGTVSSMLSGLKTRSLGLNTLGTT